MPFQFPVLAAVSTNGLLRKAGTNSLFSSARRENPLLLAIAFSMGLGGMHLFQRRMDFFSLDWRH